MTNNKDVIIEARNLSYNVLSDMLLQKIARRSQCCNRAIPLITEEVAPPPQRFQYISTVE